MTEPFPAVPELPAHIEWASHDHHLHVHPYGYVRTEPDSRGRCTWRWESDGIVIACWAYDMPPTQLCCHHAALLGVTP